MHAHFLIQNNTNQINDILDHPLPHKALLIRKWFCFPHVARCARGQCGNLRCSECTEENLLPISVDLEKKYM